MQLRQPRVVKTWIGIMSASAILRTKDNAVYMINSSDNKYIINKFIDKLQPETKLRMENVNLILSSDFHDDIPWKINQKEDGNSEIINNVEGFNNIGPASISCIYSKKIDDKISLVQYEHNIPLLGGRYYNFSLYVASHRCSGNVLIEICDEKGVARRTLRRKIPIDIEGGLQLDNYLLIVFDFKSNYNERFAKIYLEKSPTLGGSDSFLFFTRPWFGCGKIENSGWRPCQAALTHIVLNSIAQKIEPKVYLICNNRNESIQTLIDEFDLKSAKTEDIDIFILNEDNIIFESIFSKLDMKNSSNKKYFKVTIGTVLYNNKDEEIKNLDFFSRIATSFCENNFANCKIDFSFIYVDNSPIALTNAKLLSDWNKLENKFNIGFARGHNKLMNFAFNEDVSDFYIMLNPDGYPLEACFKEMIELAIEEENIGLVEAIQFPMEHPKPYDYVSLDTPWCSGACLLVTKAAYFETNGFDEHFTMYCEDVDFSWRVKNKNMMIKIAPKAQFFHDTRSRNNRFVQKNMYLSGRYLGYKWGDKDFVNWTEDLLISNGFFPEKRYLPHLPEISYSLDAKYSEFQQGFYFSLPRWY